MTMGATYVYAIIPTGDRLVLDVAGVGKAGSDHDTVYCVPGRDVAALVSASSLEDYRGLDRRESAIHLVAHQRVVEAAMREFPVLPVKFGTVLPGEEWVSRLLAQGESLFRTTLDRFAGLTQMEVVILWNLDQVFKEIGQEETIVSLKGAISGRPPKETESERVALGRMVQASLERRRTALRDRLLPPLQKVAVDLVINPIMDDSMVANVALLVDKERQGELDQRLASLDQEHDGQLLFRCVGPLPPYSFGTVEIQLPSFEAVDEARQRLGLGEAATPGEIKRAYRRLAGQSHPDRRPDEADAEARMTELTLAYQLLSVYAEGQALAGRLHSRKGENIEPAACCFDRQAVEQTLLVSVRRQEVAV